MRLSISPSFDLNKEDQKNLKEVFREVFQTKARGRMAGDTRAQRRKKAATLR